MNYAIAMGVALIVSIAIHELGHLVVARWSSMVVTDYSIGFGPRIFSFMWRGIQWSVRWIPAGGYVKIPGMDLTEDDPEPGTYALAPWYKQIAVAMAGPVTHFILAFLVLFVAYATLPTDPYNGAPGISYVAPATPAAATPLSPGDVVLAVDGIAVVSWEDTIAKMTGDMQEFTIARGGNPSDTYAVALTLADWDGVALPLTNPAQGAGAIGIASQSLSDVKTMTTSTLTGFGKILGNISNITSAALGKSEPTADRPLSVVGIVDTSADLGRGMGWFGVLLMIANLNVALGIFNLLPFYPLDGGHVVAAMANRLMVNAGRYRNGVLAVLGKLAVPTLAAFILLALLGAAIDVRLLGG